MLLSGTKVFVRLVHAFWIGRGAKSSDVMPRTDRIPASTASAAGSVSTYPLGWVISTRLSDGLQSTNWASTRPLRVQIGSCPPSWCREPSGQP